jgi:hypothetical protein
MPEACPLWVISGLMHGSKTLAYDPDSQLIDLENLIAANARRSDGGFQSRVGEVRILCVDNPTWPVAFTLLQAVFKQPVANIGLNELYLEGGDPPD